MVLDGHDGKLFVGETLDRFVVHVHVADFEAAVAGDGAGVDLEAVVLGGDVDAAGGEVLDGMIGAAMAEFQSAGGGADGEREELVAQADAGERIAADESADGFDGALGLFGITGPVNEHDAVGVEGVDVAGGGAVGEDGHPAAADGEGAQDVLLDAAVEEGDARVGILDRGRRPGFPGLGFVDIAVGGGDFLDQALIGEWQHGAGAVGELGQKRVESVVLAVQPFEGAGLGEIARPQAGEDGATDAAAAQDADELAGVDALDTWDVVLGEEVVERETVAPVAVVGREFAYDEAAIQGRRDSTSVGLAP